MLPVFQPFFRRYADRFTAVGAAFYPMARRNAARFTAVGVGVMLPILKLLVPSFTLRRGSMLPVFQPLVVGVMLPILLLLVTHFTLRRG